MRALAFVILSFLATASLAEPEEDLITERLPKQKVDFNFRQFAGYLNISEYKQLFYWYTETQGDPETDPVLLWLNGGPGCSSLQGLLIELGPLRVSDWGETVTMNPNSWNKFASIIFLDAPAGVGFSVRSDGRYNFTDDEVADDNHAALLEWYAKFPERKSNGLFIMGESYAGTYIPMLADRLAKDKENFPQFKGMSVGNGCVNDQLLFNSGIQYTYYHGLTDEVYYMNAVEKCCSDVAATECDFYSMAWNKSDPCYAEANFLVNANFFSGLDPYFLSFTCYLDGSSDEPKTTRSRHRTQRDVMITNLRRKLAMKAGDDFVVPSEDDDAEPDWIDYDPTLPPCAHHDDYSIWLQNPDLRKILRIPDYVQNYTSCSNDVENEYISTYDDMSEVVKSVVASGVKVMFFNGDMDSICNVVHNSQFFGRLGLKKIHRAKPWNDKGQKPPAIGMWTAYEGLDFLTMRDAGHFTSSDAQRPKESLQMFYNFINGNDYSTALPNTTFVTDSSSSPSPPPQTTVITTAATVASTSAPATVPSTTIPSAAQTSETPCTVIYQTSTDAQTAAPHTSPLAQTSTVPQSTVVPTSPTVTPTTSETRSILSSLLAVSLVLVHLIL